MAVLVLLGNSLNIDLSLDDDGTCFFEHDDGWRMAIMLAGEDQIVAAISVLSNIQAPPPDRLAALLTEFNWLGGLTNGHPLSWNPNSRSFVLWRSLDAETVTAGELNETMLRLVGAATRLQPTLRAYLDTPMDADETDAPPSLHQRV
ncbi:MAG: type III secretion system chaperone [Minwuiales bacterium]|nr:type III secretion system chaperone [Minwuiales bacterium]